MSLISGCDVVQSESDFYENAEKYWKSIPANLNGMLGGYERISAIDIRSSKLFLKEFIQVCFAEHGPIGVVVGDIAFNAGGLRFGLRAGQIRHCHCDFSSELCCTGAKPQRWTTLHALA